MTAESARETTPDDLACDLAARIKAAIEELYRRSGGGPQNTADRDNAYHAVKMLALSVVELEKGSHNHWNR